MKEFADIFDLGINFFLSRGGSITKEEFIEDMQNINIDFSLYEKSKYTMQAMMGLKPGSDQEEKEAILAVLDNNHNIEVIFGSQITIYIELH